MKFTIDWLKEFVPTRFSVKELSERLTLSGLEVEHIEGEGENAVFTLGITPNRGDCLSILGLAREVSALQKKPFSLKSIKAPAGKNPIKNLLSVEVKDKKGCSRYMARVVEGVRIASSPSFLQKRLQSVGIRPINNVVDCTNYVMWELGQPLHAFDYRFLRDHQIIVRTEPEKNKFTTLDGIERHCLPTDLFICDGQGPVALAGVMGGANSEVRGDTTTVVLESAYFDPKRIHATSKRLQLNSESSRRFERGVDPNNAANALHRLTELIVQTAGGVPSKEWIDLYPKKIMPRKMTLSPGEVKRILGVSLPPKEIKKTLSLLGLSGSIPTFRPDISRTIDLVEEVARLHGYDKIPATLPKIAMNLPIQPHNTCAKQITVETLTSLGFTECCHLNFTSAKKITPFTRSLTPHEESGSSWVPVSNPLSEDHKFLRPVLMPSLLDALAFNQHRQRNDIKLFEMGKVFHATQNGVEEKIHLGLVATGQEWPAQWGLKPRSVDLFSLKGALSKLTEALHVETLTLDPVSRGIRFRGEKIGWIGMIDPSILKSWEIETDVYAAEIDWEFLSSSSEKATLRFRPISKYPFIERDVALVVDNSLTAQKMIDSIRAIQNGWIQKVKLFDLFRGGNLPPNKKSIAFNIRYSSDEKTLTNEEVNEAHQRLITHLEREIGAILRK